MRISNWVFPAGAILNVGGVFLYAVLEKHSFESTQDVEYALLSATFIPSLLVGTVLAIVGSFLDRRRLAIAQTRVRGSFCSQAEYRFLCLLRLATSMAGPSHSFFLHSPAWSQVSSCYPSLLAGSRVNQLGPSMLDSSFAKPFRITSTVSSASFSAGSSSRANHLTSAASLAAARSPATRRQRKSIRT